MIPKEFWERFKNEKIAVNCQTEDEAKDFVKQCYENGIRWCDISSGYNDVGYQTYKEKICYCCGFYNKISFIPYYAIKTLTYSSMDLYENQGFQIIPYSEINKSIKEENKIETKLNGWNYRGTNFTDPVKMANYILQCDRRDKAVAEKEKQNKLKTDKARRTEELDKAYVEYFETCTEAKEKYLKTMEQYCKDYNIIIQNTNSKTYSPCKIYDIIDEIVFGK